MTVQQMMRSSFWSLRFLFFSTQCSFSSSFLFCILLHHVVYGTSTHSYSSIWKRMLWKKYSEFFFSPLLFFFFASFNSISFYSLRWLPCDSLYLTLSLSFFLRQQNSFLSSIFPRNLLRLESAIYDASLKRMSWQ